MLTAPSTDRPLPSTTAHLEALASLTPDDQLLQVVGLPGKHSPGTGTGWQEFQPGAAADAALYARRLSRTHNVYVRTTPMAARPNHGRGGEELAGSVVAMFADFDVAGPGHSPGPGQALPAWDQVGAILAAIGLPPTTLVNTGGGLHAWWILTEPATIRTADEHEHAARLVAAWGAAVIEAGKRAGFHVDSIYDLARVLRIPGTLNYKLSEPRHVWTMARPDYLDLGLPPSWVPGRRYDLGDLAQVVRQFPTSTPRRPAESAKSTRPRRKGELRPDDIINRYTWDEILRPFGWTLTGVTTIGGELWELWKRPGDAASDYSLKACSNPDNPVCVVWSTAAGLPAGPGQELNKTKVYALLAGYADARAFRSQVRRAANRLARQAVAP